MPDLEEGQSPKEQAVERIAQEIGKAEMDRLPMSRQKLVHLVFAEFKIPMPEATLIVDEYCDENAPAVPFYLKDEFEFPFLKLMAVVNSLLGVGFVYWGSHVWRMQRPSWPWFVFGAFFVACAGYSWFKTIQQELAKTN